MIEAIALIYHATQQGATNTLAYWLVTSLFAWILMGLFTRGRNEDLEELLRNGGGRKGRVLRALPGPGGAGRGPAAVRPPVDERPPPRDVRRITKISQPLGQRDVARPRAPSA